MWVKTSDGRAIVNTDQIQSIETVQDHITKVNRTDAVKLIAQFDRGEVELCADGGEIALTTIVDHLAGGYVYLDLGTLGGVR